MQNTTSYNVISFFFNVLAYIFLSCLLMACSDKEVVYNQPASFWYEGIFKNIRLGNLEAADNYFSSLQSEHLNSPLIPEAMLALGQAHLSNEEYILSDFYFKEYLKRYGNELNADYISFLRLKSHLYSFKNTSKDQQFMTDSILLIQDFAEKYPHSRYMPLVHDIEVRFVLGQNELNSAIARVYKKNDQNEAEAIYKERIDFALEEATIPTSSKMPWYMRLLNW